MGKTCVPHQAHLPVVLHHMK